MLQERKFVGMSRQRLTNTDALVSCTAVQDSKDLQRERSTYGNKSVKERQLLPGGWLPVRTVARLTGLTPDLIRAWEKRYDVVRPLRGPRGARLYSAADVERLRLLADAVEGGRAIGDVARLSDVELRALVTRKAQGVGGGLGASSTESLSKRVGPQGSAWFREQFWSAVSMFDTQRLERVLGDGFAIWGLDVFLGQELSPLIEELGELWGRGQLSVAHEHFVSATLRTFLGQLLRVRRVSGAPLVACATPAGEPHEFGLLLATLLMADRAIPLLYLGCDVPEDDLLSVVRQQGVRVVALSLVHEGNRERARATVERLLHDAPSAELWLGGREALAVGAGLKKKSRRVRIFGTLGDFLQHLDRNRIPLAGARPL